MENRNKIKLLSATFIGISSIIGSGWLFAPLIAANISGPAAILSWIIAALIIMLLALSFSEIASIYPLRGLSAVITTISHNKYFGFPFAIANWLGIIAVVALEADATVEYLASFTPFTMHLLMHNNHLTIYGDMSAIFMVILFSLINFWGISILTKANNLITLIKLIIPIITIILLLFTVFHTKNFVVVNQSFVPYGYTSIIKTILAAGIIVSFNGFQSIIAYSSEVYKPYKTIPIALFIAILVSLFIYVLIQIVFISSLPTSYITNGWHSLHMTAPMLNLLSAVGLGFFSIFIYVGSTVTPVGTAITFTGSASRLFTAMARKDQAPEFFDRVHPKYKISRRSLLFNTIFAILFILIFHSWSNLAQILSLLHIVSYLTAPIAMITLRKKICRKKYKLYIPCGRVLCYFIFIIFNYLISYADFNIVINLTVMLIGIQIIFIISRISSQFSDIKLNIISILKILLYILCLPLICYLNKSISAISFDIVLVIFSTLFLYILTN